jgi:lysyl-tRNA synthetase, class II
MASLEELRDERLKKKAHLVEAGIDPYPNETHRTDTVEVFLDRFTLYEAGKDDVVLAGRIMSMRGQGGIAFCDLYDGTGRTQIVLKKDEIPEDVFDLFQNTVDTGDFVEVSGKAYTTQRGHQSLFVSSWRMLSKSLRPIPDEWYGLKDEDETLRRRYLDILLNKDVAEMVRKRSVFWNTMRSFLLAQDFIEVETPVLENTTGGADARPFITHHNALDIDVFLRISAGELWQKKLMIAGIPRTFEIGRIFRNEGMSPEHLQDYTQMEFYMAYSDYKKGMEMVKALYREVAEKTFGTSTFTIKGFTVDLAADWVLYDFCGLINEAYSIDPLTATVAEIESALKSHDIDYDKATLSVERGVDLLWKKIRKGLGGPGFLVNVPVYLEPLAKKNRDGSETVERFQIIIAGSEVGKGFSELNDPVDQRERFMKQQALRDAGDDEAQMADMEYVEAMEYGMPPAFGFGISERFFSFLLDKPVREAQIFPLMKPRE